MHPSVARAIQEIDAAVFSGDTFDEPVARAQLIGYAEAWIRQLKEDTLSEELTDDERDYDPDEDRTP